ncbi:sodium/calcium exchanger NCL2 isoform X2 [Cryptomeria japonica]|uniref:sodium/calcium exchanger NCL2 isoform X2 n=1 Tax=Cryptomeria japonica TaxID=3369 RepID=UPI0027DA4782|nr:sodium/calcium exchanger NCL2 isoform X2 [Cryptomeria japonica]
MGRLSRHTIRRFMIVMVLLLYAGVDGAGKGGYLLQKSVAGLDCEANLVSDGGDGENTEGFIAKVSTGWKNGDLESSSCEETYGFMPCTRSVLGNLFLVAVYGYLLLLSAKFMSDGSETLLTVTGPGLIGGLFLPILGAFPDALLVLVSGLSGSTETAQSQVLIGMGLLAGSTVMLLTLLWGSCLVVGKCDISGDSVAIDSQDTTRFSLLGSGISTDKSTRTASRIMVASVVPFLIVQIPQLINSSSAKRISVLVACIAAILCLLSYCIYQVIQPWIQKRRIEYAKHKHIVSSVLHHVHKKGLGTLVGEDGELDVDVAKGIFNSLDSDGDGHLSEGELRGLLVGLELHQQNASAKDALDKIMSDFDTSRDGKLDLMEFEEGIRSWLHVAQKVDLSNNYSRKVSDLERTARDELDNLIPEDTKDDNDNPYQFYLKAVSLMLGGAVIAGIFADPFVDAVDNFSDATSIPSFFISFIAMPLATNSSEGVSALIFASRKKTQTASLTYSEIYGAVTMNNTLCLGIFLAIVYIRGLEWDFSAEVLVILLVVLAMGLFGSFRTTFPLWMSFVAFLLYPLTLAIVYVLDYVLGWS